MDETKRKELARITRIRDTICVNQKKSTCRTDRKTNEGKRGISRLLLGQTNKTSQELLARLCNRESREASRMG